MSRKPIQLVLSHVGTDFDGLASMVLAQKLYPGAQLVFPGSMGGGVSEFYALHRRHFPALSRKKALAAQVHRLIVVDTRNASRLGPFRSLLQRPEIELHIYDHHPPSAEAVKGDQEWVEAVGAAATLLLERCRSQGRKLSPIEATLALIALHEETGSFRYASTTNRDLEAAAYAMAQGANLEVVNHFLKDPLSEDQRSLLEEYLANGEMVHGHAGTTFICSATRRKSVFGLGLLASRILELEGCDAVCTVLEVEGKHSSIAARSDSDALDVGSWMRHWGGGGHTRAAAASRFDDTPQNVLDRLRQLAQADTAQIPLLARDLMSSDVHSLREDISIEQAMADLVELGINAACIVAGDDKILGIVSRGDLSKALEHDLGHAPATSVMTHRVTRVGPDTPLEEVRRLVVERDVGTLPVLEDDRLVGIVSRTDLLREMYDQQRQGWSRGQHGGKMSLTDTPEPFRTWLRVAAEAAQANRVRLYAVGGFVRDKLLGRFNEDLDLVVEGNAIELAAELAERLGGRLITHEKYLTATVKFSDGNKLDLATARREVYCRPAALPEVAQSNLKSDLYRRDFTINSLALQINPELQGTVIDFFGGQQDLESKAIRVLHNHSFFDDPTRIVRAVRFEQRLGFSIEPHTQQLIKAALKEQVLLLAKPERLREELRLALSETEPVRVLRRLAKLKILTQIHSELAFGHKTHDRVRRALAFREKFPELVENGEFWMVPLYLMAFELSDKGAEELRERFGWSVLEWPFPPDQALQQLSRATSRRSEVAKLLDRLSGVAVTVLASLSSHVTMQERISDYLVHVRGKPGWINGGDILAAGVPRGPEVRHWKQLALDAQRDGEFEDREGALAWLEAQCRSASHS